MSGISYLLDLVYLPCGGGLLIGGFHYISLPVTVADNGQYIHSLK